MPARCTCSSIKSALLNRAHLVIGALWLAVAAMAGPVLAQSTGFVAPPIAPMAIVPPAFDITGFIQEATLDTAGAICKPKDPRLAGGTVTLNGQKVVIPCNTI